MIAHWDIIQGTEEWHRIRYRKIGGTRSKQLYDFSDALLVELVGEHLEEFEIDLDSYESSDMIRGHELEPIALQRINDKFGLNLIPCGWLQNEDIPILGYSPDGISEDLTIMAEIKCPAMKKHTATILNGIVPIDNINQCIHAFAVNDRLERLIFGSFRPESAIQLFTYELTRQSEVNVGTEKTQKIVSIQFAVDKLKANGLLMTDKIAQKVDSLTF